jgi:F0F1-type ATP synthase alpha subunit
VTPATTQRPDEHAVDTAGISAQHIEELMSLSDGHILLRANLFFEGAPPAVDPTSSLTRIRDTRIPAMQVS